MTNLLFSKLHDQIGIHNQRLNDIQDRLDVIDNSLSTIEDMLDEIEAKHMIEEEEIFEHEMVDREGVEPPTY